MNKSILIAISILLSLLSTQGMAAGKMQLGLEVDAAPYLLGGHYASATVAIDQWQLRLITTEFETPDFYLQDGFESNIVDVNALILDYYFEGSPKGFWIGSGFEKWNGEVVDSRSKVKKKYNSYLLTVGGGYAWYFTKHFYINPWAGLHIPISGDDKVSFSSSTFNVKTTGEVSVKLGVKF